MDPYFQTSFQTKVDVLINNKSEPNGLDYSVPCINVLYDGHNQASYNHNPIKSGLAIC